MGKGGGSSTQVSEPWKQAQPYLTDVFSQARTQAGTPQQYFPGDTTVGPTASEGAAWNQINQYNQGLFGQGGQFGQTMGALGSSVAGNTTLGSMASQLSGPATQSLLQGIQQGPGSVGRYGFDTQLNAGGMAPQLGKAGSLDATGALQSMLSGTPDYAGVQGSIDAANKPLLRQFNEELLPGLNSRATFLNNGTGGIKTLAKAVPDLAERMSDNALSITEGERQRALGAQQNAAGMITQGGLQSYGLGLDAARAQSGLQQALAGQNLATDQSNAGLRSDYMGNLLNFGSLAGQLGNQQGAQSLTAAGMLPSLGQFGQTPGQSALQYANYDRALQEDSLQAQMDRFNFGQTEPINRLSQYSQLINGMAGLGGQTSGSAQGSRAAGALGGALAGSQLGSSMSNNPYASLFGAIGGGLLGGWG